MVSFGEKAKIKKAGNLNDGRSYVITTVLASTEGEIKSEVTSGCNFLVNICFIKYRTLREKSRYWNKS